MTTEPIALRLTVAPANVAGNEAATDFFPTPRGNVKRLLLQFPDGCNGAVHLVIEDRHGQLAPVRGGDFALSGVTTELAVDIPVGGNQPALRLVGWADAGNTYSHVLDVLVVMESQEAI